VSYYGVVEIESQWTRRREKLGIMPTARVREKPAHGWGEGLKASHHRDTESQRKPSLWKRHGFGGASFLCFCVSESTLSSGLLSDYL